jgi:tRNA-dihydrouridine synthase
VSEVIEVMMKHLDLCCGFHGERGGVVLFRKFFGWYAKGIAGVNALKDRAFRAETKQQMQGMIRELTPGSSA